MVIDMQVPYRQLLDNLPDGIIALDLEGRIIYCNPAATDMLHYDSPLEGRLIAEMNEPKLHSFLSNARSGDKLMLDHPADTLQIAYTDLNSGDLRVGAMLTINDIGQKQRVARMRQEFTANVSHELKTPLTSISGYAEMIANGMAKQQDIERFAKRIEMESKRMLTLISDIIKLSELDEVGRGQHLEQVDLYQIAAECVDILLPAAMLRGVSVRLYGSKTMVVGNRSLLGELIYNLLDNAIRYNRDNGDVKLRVSNGTIRVRDTGIGIPKQHQEHVFERFYRVDKSRSKETGGTGLGLAIVKHICEHHHAELTLESSEGIGTVIEVRF